MARAVHYLLCMIGTMPKQPIEQEIQMLKEETKTAKRSRKSADKPTDKAPAKRSRRKKSEMLAAEGGPTLSKKEKKLQEFYARYPHVVPESVREPSETEKLGSKRHGLICTVLCACGEERTINTQDAFQVQACRVCQDANKKDQARARRAIKRNSKLAELSPEELAAKKEELANRLELLQATS